VTTRDLALGETVTRAVLDVKELPEAYVEERHIPAADFERVLGAHVTTALTGGGPLLWTDLDMLQDGRTLSSLVRVGMRAFVLPDRDVSFDGLLRPGDRVDVLLSPADPNALAKTLLENVLVLTVGGKLGQDESDAEQAAGRVTLSVTPAQAELLAPQEGEGSLRLALRNPQDIALTARAPEGLSTAQPVSGVSRAR
jgi:pilus assembly protein CpaB